MTFRIEKRTFVDNRCNLEYIDAMKEEILTVKELCDYLKLTKKTVLRLLNTGEIPGRKIGGSWRILKSELDKYLKGELKESS
jgi:excisionase family DNA binding protein